MMSSVFYLYNTERSRWHTEIRWEWYTLTHLYRNELLQVVRREVLLLAAIVCAQVKQQSVMVHNNIRVFTTKACG